MTNRKLGLAMSCVLLLLSSAAYADDDTLPWQSLSDGQRQILQVYAEQWESFPVKRRQQLVSATSRYLEMTPEQKEAALGRYRTWRAMPPEQQTVLWDRYQTYIAAPVYQRQRVGNAYRNYEKMSPEERAAWRLRFAAEKGKSGGPGGSAGSTDVKSETAAPGGTTKDNKSSTG
jgi:hypothetical protein